MAFTLFLTKICISRTIHRQHYGYSGSHNYLSGTFKGIKRIRFGIWHPIAKSAYHCSLEFGICDCQTCFGSLFTITTEKLFGYKNVSTRILACPKRRTTDKILHNKHHATFADAHKPLLTCYQCSTICFCHRVFRRAKFRSPYYYYGLMIKAEAETFVDHKTTQALWQSKQ